MEQEQFRARKTGYEDRVAFRRATRAPCRHVNVESGSDLDGAGERGAKWNARDGSIARCAGPRERRDPGVQQLQLPPELLFFDSKGRCRTGARGTICEFVDRTRPRIPKSDRGG